jgi:hypothetical protein
LAKISVFGASERPGKISVVGRRREPDRERVEVVEHLPPEPEDRAVALVDDDNIERFRRTSCVVLDRHRLGCELVGGVLVELGVEVGLASEDRVDALDRRDRHARDGVDPVRREVLDVVELGELAAVVGGREPLELLQRLAAEVRAVDEEEDAARVRVLDEAVADVRGRERLARAGRHLDQGARVAGGEGLLQVGDGAELGGPEAGLGERREGAEAVPERGRGRVLRDVREPARERLGPVEREDLSARRVRVERVGEARLGACGLVDEGERPLECRRDLFGDALDVLCRLPGDAAESLALLLRLDDARGGAVDEEEVVRTAVRRLRMNSRTATPRAADRLTRDASWTAQPAAASMRSISMRALASGVRYASSPSVTGPIFAHVNATYVVKSANSATVIPAERISARSKPLSSSRCCGIDRVARTPGS